MKDRGVFLGSRSMDNAFFQPV